MEEIRRLLPRQFTDWRGKYMVEGDPEQRWRDCCVIDLSSAGAGLECLDATPEETAGHRIIVAVQLRGDVRHAGPGEHNGLRVGIEFVDVTEEERGYLDSLAELHAVW